MIIRRTTAGDEPVLRRLAELDSQCPPDADALVAAVDGEVLAALSLADGRTVADPFRPTAELVELLRMRAAQLEAPPPARRRSLLNRLVPQRT